MTIVGLNENAILHNVNKLKKHIGNNVKICAVIKANAYSQGDVRVAKLIERHVDFFAVSALHEAEKLVSLGITKPILFLGVCNDWTAPVHISVNSFSEFLAKYKSIKSSANLHIAVNTGKNRFGINTIDELYQIIELAKTNNNIKIYGIYSHFAYPASDKSQVKKQQKSFEPFVKVAKKLIPNIVAHFASSATVVKKNARYNMVRVGALLYGGVKGYKTALSLSSKIIQIQHIKCGQRVGYDGKFEAKEDMVVGIVGGGYANFVPHDFCGHVLIDNTPCKILGKICMNNFFVDVTCVKNPLNKLVKIIGDNKRINIVSQSKFSNISTHALITFIRQNY